MRTNLSIQEKVRGALIGYAIGDALGLGTEFMTQKEIARKYPQGLTRYDQIIRDAHRAQWKRGEFTNDTIYIKMVADSLVARNGLDINDFAHRLKEWYRTDPIDVLANMRWLLSQDDYETDPKRVAARVWKDMNSNENPSDGLGKALIIGLWNENVGQNARDLSCSTHPQLRCQGSSEIIATMANSLMWRNEEASYEDLLKIAEGYDADITKYVEIARHGDISDFSLDHESTIWYVRKAMGSALWAVWHCKSIDEALVTIVNEGGDSDTNASLAAGLTALKYGYSTIDPYYIDNLIGRDELLNTADRLSKVLEERFK